MKKFYKFCLACLISFLVMFYSMSFAYAEDVETAETEYLNGGIGQEEAEEIRAKAGNFNLRLYLSEGNPAHAISDAQITISDKQGNVVMNVVSRGPMLFIKLDKGNYKIIAKFKGITISRNALINSRRGKNIYINWKNTGNDVALVNEDNLLQN